LGCRRIGDWLGASGKHRVTHAGDLEDGHGGNMGSAAAPVKSPAGIDTRSAF
jgi:hypothetical protein